MLLTNFQAPKLSGSQEEFLNSFLSISMIQTQDPLV